jgi:hypothetical protein
MGRFGLPCFLFFLLTGQSLAIASGATLQNETDGSCHGLKGDKGNYGHPGIRGLRGFKGIAGPSGPKGDSGNFGPTGPPGSQGPKGSLGERGPKGSIGVKGQKGGIGPRGVEGADGDPGVAGHTGPVGPRGSKGEKGLKGVAGLTGPRGSQGVPGDPIDEETLEKYFNPVKSLQAEVSLIRKSLDEENPAFHLHGDGSRGAYNYGYVVTQWYTNSGQWHSPILRGGMSYSGGYITIPKDGLYYIYAQLHYQPRSGHRYCGLRINLKNRNINEANFEKQLPSGDKQGSRYTGLLKILSKGDRLSVGIIGPCYFHFFNHFSQFGAFRVL